MELTERILNDAAGWQVMKQARALHELERVTGASWEPPLMQGRVREGEKELRSGLRILSRTNIENLCGCRDSRHRGTICAHSVAVGLEVLKPRRAGPSPAPAAGGKPLPPCEVGPQFSANQGESIELFIVLPPNFKAAWEKRSVVVGCEVMRGGKRALLASLEKRGAYRCGEEDRRVIEALQAMNAGDLPGLAAMMPEHFLQLLNVLKGHPRITFARSSRAIIASEPIRPALSIIPGEKGALRLRVVLQKEWTVLRAGGRQPWIFDGSAFRTLAPDLPAAYHDLLDREIVLPADQAHAFLQRELPTLRQSLDVPGLDVTAVTASEVPALAPAFTLSIEGSLNFLTANLLICYGDHSFTFSSVPAQTTYRRSAAAEQEAVSRLRDAGFTGPDSRGQWALKGEAQVLAFFARDLPHWQRVATVEIGARFGQLTRDVERVNPVLEINSSGENWFELQVRMVSSGGEHISAAEIRRLLHGGQSHRRGKNGKVVVFDPAILDELDHVVRDCDPNQPEPGRYRIGRRHAAYVEAVAADSGLTLQASHEWRNWASATRRMDRLQPIPLGSLETVLRPYQKDGVYWLNLLAVNGLGGILADEMGLGKTLQMLAFLRHSRGKALIVCPSSLVFNWEREAARFTPERRVALITGANRLSTFHQSLAAADLVITSYPLLRRDISLYQDIEFDSVVLDEAQHMKNPGSQNAVAACALKAHHRFALTGTPLENSVRDIWSLMHFLMPGYLGSRADFRERYERNLQTPTASAENARLLKRLRPFLLRRLKKDVVTEMPSKVEQVAYCELSDEQNAVYHQLIGETRRQISDLAGNPSKARLTALTALLRLRQVCCDLRLLGNADTSVASKSGKLALLEELLEQAIDGGHRVLVFSQFVGMLQIIRATLESEKIDYCYLDGATRDRAAEVDRFQNGTAPVFLISLKAGGVGLNLTAADTVIHFDPWWNPAAEAQATDRAHRIGQDKVVTAYKLIARGTLEEKVIALQKRKQEAFAELMEADGIGAPSSLDLSDISELLAEPNN